MRKSLQSVTLFGVWVAIFAAFSLALPASFPTPGNFETIVRQATIVGFGAVGMTLIIISGAIDLSAGSLVALMTVVIAKFLSGGQSPLVAALLAVMVAGLCGLLNGALIAKAKLTPFIVTLATLLAFRGAAKGLANEQKVNAPMTWLTDLTASLAPSQKWMMISYGSWLLLAWSAFAAWVLHKTVLGRNIVAVGSNEEASRLAGIHPAFTRSMAFTFGGVSIGLAGLMQFSRLSVGDPTVAMGLELDMIAGVVIGGGSLSGGEGRISGTLIGVMIMMTIRSGCNQLGLSNWVQEIVTALVILLAVGIDRYRVLRRGV